MVEAGLPGPARVEALVDGSVAPHDLDGEHLADASAPNGK
jgi:hypothetical protein